MFFAEKNQSGPKFWAIISEMPLDSCAFFRLWVQKVFSVRNLTVLQANGLNDNGRFLPNEVAMSLNLELAQKQVTATIIQIS